MKSSIALLVLLMAGSAAAEPRARRPDYQALAADVAREIDVLRANPKAYAAHLKELRRRYRGKLLRLDGRDPIRTKEGKKPLEEAIKRLERSKKLGALTWEAGLAKAAAEHARDIGKRGVVDHYGARGESPIDRVTRHGVLQGRGGENIAVAFADARLVVVYLLIDDGIADRGHREALLDGRYDQVGVGCGPHDVYKHVCVMDFATGYSSLVR